MKLPVLCFAFFMSQFMHAQKHVTYTIKPGVNIRDVIPMSEIFRYPDFVAGTVVFKDGRSIGGKLNYNVFIGQIQFIDDKVDTLSLANENTISRVLILKDTFYFDKEYYRVVNGHGPVQLVQKIYFKEFIQKPGAYGLSSSTTSVDNLSALLEKRSYTLNTSQEMILVRYEAYAIANKNGALVYPDKKKLLKAFPKHTSSIKNYLLANSGDVTSQEDMSRLTQFIEDLK